MGASFARSVCDARKHKRLPLLNAATPRFAVPDGLLPLDAETGKQLASQALVAPELLAAVQRQEHPAFCAAAAATSVTAAHNTGIVSQWNMVEAFQKAKARHVFSHYGWHILDWLPDAVRYPLLRHLLFDGMPMALLAEWFRCQGYLAKVVSGEFTTAETLREDILQAFSPARAGEGAAGSSLRGTGFRKYIIVNYSRTAMGQRMFSGGHYAPVGGFHAGDDKVLLLEVNSFRYPSVWVDVRMLANAVATKVNSGKTWRGYLCITCPPDAGDAGHGAKKHHDMGVSCS
mmetsp:Transcript_43768/g.101093  ORF Transcript_43768/g.101093 Transcript_43768/m.101093 type:complete len:288 (-) Transcript_43768:98-961(-)